MILRYCYHCLLILLTLPFLAPAATAQHTNFQSLERYLQEALDDTAMQDFEYVVKNVKHNIFWQQEGQENKYQSAYRRSTPFFRHLGRDDVPGFVFLIPYLESGWHPTRGKPSSDYGYWQMVSEVVAEIKTLDEASEGLRNSHPDEIRSNPALSTEAALIHLRRYYFYFRHVANFPEADAWLFAVTAFNWGAGNVKNLLQAMQQTPANNKKTIGFAAFYHHLFITSKQRPNDKSMRVALEYLPNLWNIALLLQPLQQTAQEVSENNAFTLKRSSSVSIP